MSGDEEQDDADRGERATTTFTYRPTTGRWLLDTYQDALTINEALRMAISDARLVREGDGVDVDVEQDEDADDDA